MVLNVILIGPPIYNLSGACFMTTEKIQTIDITLIQIKSEIYPRAEIDPELVEQYRKAMEAGEKFPPIVVQKDTNTIIDGLHRLKINKILRKETIDVEILDIPDSELRAEAVRRNIKHGKRLTAMELRKAVIALRFTDKKSEKEIAEIVDRTEGRISQICKEYEESPRNFSNFNSKDREKPIDLRKKVDTKMREEILKDLEADLSGKQIADKHTVSQSTVSQIKKDHEAWISSPIYIKAMVSQIAFFFKAIFANKLLNKAQLEFKKGGVLVGNFNEEKQIHVIAVFKNDYFWEYKVDHPINACVTSDILAQLPASKNIANQSVELVLLNENTWKLRYSDCIKTHEVKNLDWRDFPLENLVLDQDGLPARIHVKAKAFPQSFPRNEKGKLTLRMKNGEITFSFKCHNVWPCEKMLKLEFLERKSDATASVDLTLLDKILKIRNDPIWIGMWSDQNRMAFGYAQADYKTCFILG